LVSAGGNGVLSCEREGDIKEYHRGGEVAADTHEFTKTLERVLEVGPLLFWAGPDAEHIFDEAAQEGKVFCMAR
jgi:hypothetical protein